MQESGLPPGFRFHPTDEELVTYYLTRKVTEFGFVAKAIADVDLTKCEPWDLPAKASMGEKEWYFFSMKDRKYPTGLRTNRATEAGYWKTTGKDKEIFHFGVLVGMKKTLVFYKGRAPRGEKTSWVMHEYRLQNSFPYKPSKEEWIVCRVFKKISINVKKPEADFPAMPPAVLLGSPCDNTTSLSGLAEFDVSALSNLVVNPSASACINSNYEGGGSCNNKLEMMNMNSSCLSWVPSLSLASSGLMTPTPGILKALALIHDGINADTSNLNYTLAGGDGNALLQSTLNQEPVWRGY